MGFLLIFEVVDVYKIELENSRLTIIISMLLMIITLVVLLVINKVWKLRLFLFITYSKSVLETVLSFQLFYWAIDFGVFKFIEEF